MQYATLLKWSQYHLPILDLEPHLPATLSFYQAFFTDMMYVSDFFLIFLRLNLVVEFSSIKISFVFSTPILDS